jgi:deoxyribodipyrimidine photo-lyase
VHYYPYVEPHPGAGKGLLAKLAASACVVVTDEFPCFFLPRMVASAARQLSVRLEQVDSNGLLPLRASPHDFPTAYSFRRFLQKTLPKHLADFPRPDPLARRKLPPLGQSLRNVQRHWPPAGATLLRGDVSALAALPIDHSVRVATIRGGRDAAQARLRYFLKNGLPHYDAARNEPGQDVTSGLSAFLHFGHISAHQVFRQVMATANWRPDNLAVRVTGSRQGWWGASVQVEAFLDQLVTWRELGYNFCAHRADYARYVSLPAWTKKTLAEHARDEREYVYSLEQFEQARTHDALWNAAQVQLVREGRIHNYLRMLWGKKILEWSRSPRRALEIMIELNNKYALDGRDPNSYSGIFWCMGRYDRPWGPERPVFGTVRYMSSQNTARKLRIKSYIRLHAND